MSRRNDIDLIKGFAIIAVILYHIGLLPYGFLGVDCFLVISGFLIIPKLSSKIADRTFKYPTWLFHRLSRIWPITLAACFVSLCIGYFVMIPDDYENLAASVVASNLFSNNILEAITTQNYWDTSNEFKPLMQMWYLGVVVQFFVIFPLILMLVYKLVRLLPIRGNYPLISVIIVGIISFSLYLLPGVFTEKFYFVQFRIWELAAGGIIGILVTNKNLKIPRSISLIAIVMMCIIFCISMTPVSAINNITIIGETITGSNVGLKMTLTIAIVFLSCTAISNTLNIHHLAAWGGVLFAGKMSLSLFVWHQIILAYSRITVLESLTWQSVLLLILLIIIISYFSYLIIERIKLKSRISRIIFFILLAITTASAFCIYNHAGVVRDVPELGISMENPFVNRNTEYTDQIYKLDKPFETDKIHVLVVGNSFARDFACILKEYNTLDNLEISYSYLGNVEPERARLADYIFTFGSKVKVPESITNYTRTDCKIYGISTKYFGKSFGVFYNKRNSPDYFLQSIKTNAKCDSINKQWEKTWGTSRFINLMDSIRLNDGTIPIFTPDNRVISFDCRHLTQDGCKFYANKINFDKIFSESNK